MIARSFEKLSSVPLMINSTVRPGENSVVQRFSEIAGEKKINKGVTVLCQRRVSFTRGNDFIVLFWRGVSVFVFGAGHFCESKTDKGGFSLRNVIGAGQLTNREKGLEKDSANRVGTFGSC